MTTNKFSSIKTISFNKYSGKLRGIETMRYSRSFNKKIRFRNLLLNRMRSTPTIKKKITFSGKYSTSRFISLLRYTGSGPTTINSLGFFFKGFYRNTYGSRFRRINGTNNPSFYIKLVCGGPYLTPHTGSLLKSWLATSKNLFREGALAGMYYKCSLKLPPTQDFNYINGTVRANKATTPLVLGHSVGYTKRPFTLKYLSSWYTVSLYRHILGASRGSFSLTPSIYNISKQYLLLTGIFFPPSSGISSFRNLIIKDIATTSTPNIRKSRTPQLYKAAITLKLHRSRWLNRLPHTALVTYSLPPLFTTNVFRWRYKRIKRILSSLKLLRRPNRKSLQGFNNFFTGVNSDYLYNYDNLLIQLSGNKVSGVMALCGSQKFLMKNISLVYTSRLQAASRVGYSSLISNKLNFLGKLSLSRSIANLPNISWSTNSNPIVFFRKFLTTKLFTNTPCIIKFLFIRGALVEDNYTCFILNKLHCGVNKKSLNLVPNTAFNYKLTKSLVSYNSKFFIKDNFTPWIYNNVIRFMEFCSGKRAFVQNYSFLNQSVDLTYTALYKRWMPRLFFYERRLGHRFFLEEALHILHIGFVSRDSKILNSWLSAIIKRISFWKTRLIFRFIRYLFNNYFSYVFRNLGLKGFKVRLKGKISVAGNSRKRSILYRSGTTTHSNSSVRVVHTFSNISTFTGALGFQIWLFY